MIYLDNAATSWPKPRAVYHQMAKCIKRYCANPGRSGHKMSIKSSEKVYECRENICKLFSLTNPEEISFTSNATESLNIGIKGLLEKGSHVITTSIEHNSVIRPLKELEKDGLIKLSIVRADKQGNIKVKDISKEINKKTNLIITTHASNVTGTLVPIKEIADMAKEKNLYYMVDAAQTSGLYPINLNEINIDILAFPGHKGLLGPQGTGCLYVRKGIKLKTLKEGGTGSASENLYQPEFVPDRYESGTLNTPGIVGLNEGIKHILKVGIDEIVYHKQKLTKYMLESFCNMKDIQVYGSLDNNKQIGLISINIKGKDSIEVCNELDKIYNIAARGGLHCAYLTHKTIGTLRKGTIRFSIGLYNKKKEITKTVNVINKIRKA